MLERLENMNRKIPVHCESYYGIEIPLSINHFTLHFNLHAAKKRMDGGGGGENWDIAEKKLSRGTCIVVLFFTKGKNEEVCGKKKAVRLLSYQKAIYTSAELKQIRATCDAFAEASLQASLT